MRNSPLRRSGMARVNEDHTVLPVTHTFIHKWYEPHLPLLLQAAEHYRPLAGTHWRYPLLVPTEGKRLSRPKWLVTYRNKVPPLGVEPGHPSQY